MPERAARGKPVRAMENGRAQAAVSMQSMVSIKSMRAPCALYGRDGLHGLDGQWALLLSAAHFFIKKPVKPASVATNSRMNLFSQEPFVGYEYYLPSLFLREAIDGKSHSIPIIVVSKKKTAVRDDLPIVA